VQQLVGQLTAEDIQELDKKMQAMIRQLFQSLKEICLGSANQVKALEAQMQAQAEAFVGASLAGNNVVEMFMARHGQSGEAEKLLAEAFESAAPKLAKFAEGPEIRVLALPPSNAAGELFKTHVVRAFVDAPPTVIESPDDVYFYREQALAHLERLPQLGMQAEDAYRQMVNSDPLSPHSRIDIAEWRTIQPNSEPLQ
jgi:hypothetical protein